MKAGSTAGQIGTRRQISWRQAGTHIARCQNMMNFGLMLIYPGSLVLLSLIGISIFYQPVALSPRVHPPLRYIVLLWLAQFATLWYWLTILSVILGWLFVWGDRHGSPMSLICLVAAVFAAFISSATAVRLRKERATSGYLSAVISLTGILIVLAVPSWLSRVVR